MSQTQLASMFLGNPSLSDRDDRLKGVASRLDATIHILDGQEDVILDYITAKNIIKDTHRKSLKDTLETYNFITFADKRYSQHLEKRNRIVIPDEDGSLVEFVIFEAAKYKDTEGHKAQVFANASFLELKKANIIYPGTYKGTASQLLGIALNDTGRKVGIVEAEGIKTLRVDKHISPYDFIKRIAKEFECELRFPIEHNGNRITGRYVDLLKMVGEWRGREVEFGKDLDGIRRTEEQDIVTALLGLGPEDEDGNRIEVLVTDDEALQRWGRLDENGNLKHLIEPYEIQSDRQEMTEQEARQYTRTALNKRINTQVSYEATIIDLESVPGMENKKIRFGDTIKIKDTSFNPPLYVEARIFEQDRSIKAKGKKDVKLGDFIEHTEEEVHAIWRQLQNDIKKRITHYEMAEYTYDKLTIDDKDETVFEEGKTFAEATGTRAEENAKSFAVEEDKKIKLDVEQYADTAAEEKANSALEQAKMYAVAKTVYENQMEQIASDIADRAPLEYVDGEFRVIKDDLDSFNVQIEEKADKSTVYTIEEVDNRINNLVSVTQYETDQQGIVQQLESHGTRIGQNEHAIGLKADASHVDSVENELTRKIGNVEVTAEGASITASEVRADLDGLEIGGRNLLLDTPGEEVEGIEFRSWNSDYYIVTDSVIDEIKKGGTYTMSVYYTHTESNNDSRFGLTFQFYTDSGFYSQYQSYDTFIESGETGWSKYTFELPDVSDIDEITGARVYIRSDNNVGSEESGKFVKYKMTKLEKGNKATDWTPAPEDTDEAISNVSGRVETLDGEITALAGEVSLKASQSVVDSLEQRVSTAEGELEVLPGEINAKVSKDGVIAAINLTSETAKIKAENIELVGAVTVLSDITGDLGNITAGNITGATISQSGKEGNITLDEEGFLFEGYNSRILMSAEKGSMDYDDRVSIIFEASDNYGYMEILQDKASSVIRSDSSLTIDSVRTNIHSDTLVNGYVDVLGYILSSKSSINGGLHLTHSYDDYASGAYHALTAHTTGGYLVFYPQRYTDQDIFRIRSHNQKSDYQNEFRINMNGNALTRGNHKAMGFTVSDGSPSEGQTRDRYHFQYDDSNGNLDLISKSSSGTWYNRIQLEGRGSGKGIQIWDEITSHGTRNNTVTWAGRVAMGASSARMGYVSSSRRYKLMIDDVDVDPYNLLKVDPKSWYDKKNTEEYADYLTKIDNGEDVELNVERIERIPGLIAEEVEEAGLPLFVDYNEDDEVESVQYDRLWTLLIPIVRDIIDRINKLEEKLK